MHESWQDFLQAEFNQPYFKKLSEFLTEAYNNSVVYPPKQQVFSAFTTDLNDVKVVILGQDPYHEPGQAHGLAFSVKKGVMPPPSLKNIYKELHDDLGVTAPSHGELTEWAKQGVLLLNTALTVRRGQANSHRGKGWETFTDSVIRILNDKPEPLVFLLWGGNAKGKLPLLTNPKHLVLTAAHPSPLSAFNGFFGCRHFSKANAYLQQNGVTPIDWQIKE